MNRFFVRGNDASLPVRSHPSARCILFQNPFTSFKSAALLLLIGGAVCASAQDASHAGKPTKQIHVVRPSSQLRQSGQLHAPFSARAVQPKFTPVNTGSGIVFTCDPSIDAKVAGTCAYLNTTVAGWYNSTFTNANAKIYITYGDTGLGESIGYGNQVTYDQYLAAVTANTNKSAVQTTALSSLSTYDTATYTGGNVGITGALASTLGFTALNGITPPTPALGENLCTLGDSGCYNEVIVISNHSSISLYFDNVGGPEPSDAYDFYTTVAHETDEVLGTSSCTGTNSNGNALTDNCGAGIPSVVDLFRYSSAGHLVLASSLDGTAGQYFSYDGGTTNDANGVAGTSKVYNTLFNGDDYADYVSSDPDCGTNQAVQDAEGCPGEDKGLSILNDGGSEITILNAVGYDVPAAVTAPAVTLSTHSIPFGNQVATTTSSPMTVKLTNTGTATLDITSITVTGTNASSFSFPNTCGTTLTAGSSCTLSGTFTPATTGPFSAAITFVDNASDSPQSVSLSGTGTAPGAPAVTLSTNTVAFGNQVVNTTSATQTVTITNTGGATLNFTGFTRTGEPSAFLSPNNCGSTLAVGAHCTITASFTPESATAFAMTISIADNAANSPQIVSFTGTGVPASTKPPQISFSDNVIRFGSEEVGDATGWKHQTVKNIGGSTLTFSGITLTGHDTGSFAFETNCGSQLAPGASCMVSENFKPLHSGDRTAAVSFADNTNKTPQRVYLTGKGTK